MATLVRKISFAYFDTSVGKCAIAWDDSGITAIQLPEKNMKQTLEKLGVRLRCSPVEALPPLAIKSVIRDVCSHLSGQSHDLSAANLNFSGVSPFFRRVYEEARKIPPGTTVTYGELARIAGSPAAARAVGQAMARNPYPLVVPCHRVLGSAGAATGFSAYGGCDLKSRLLAIEGVKLGEEKTVKRRRAGTRSNCPFDAKAAVEYLRAKDKKLARIIDQVGPFKVELDEMASPFEALAESIVYQQLTGKAAATIFGRVVALYGDRLPDPERILETPIETLRGAGLSNAKALAIKDLAEKQLLGVIPDLVQLAKMSDDEIVERLITVRGIGRWTVEMLLIFRLGRPDVLPIHDYGVRKGFAVTYGLKDKLPTPLELGRYGERWSPYRSVAAWYMWRATEL